MISVRSIERRKLIHSIGKLGLDCVRGVALIERILNAEGVWPYIGVSLALDPPILAELEVIIPAVR